MNRTASPRSARNASTSSVTVPSVVRYHRQAACGAGSLQRHPDARVPAAQRGGGHRVVLEEEVLDRVLLLARPALASAGGERVGPLRVRGRERLPRRGVEHGQVQRRRSRHQGRPRLPDCPRGHPRVGLRRPRRPAARPLLRVRVAAVRAARGARAVPDAHRGRARGASRGPTTRASTTCSWRSARWSGSSSRSPGRRRSVSRWSCWRAGRCSRPPSCSSRRTAPWPAPRRPRARSRCSPWWSRWSLCSRSTSTPTPSGRSTSSTSAPDRCARSRCATVTAGSVRGDVRRPRRHAVQHPLERPAPDGGRPQPAQRDRREEEREPHLDGRVVDDTLSEGRDDDDVHGVRGQRQRPDGRQGGEGTRPPVGDDEAPGDHEQRDADVARRPRTWSTSAARPWPAQPASRAGAARPTSRRARGPRARRPPARRGLAAARSAGRCGRSRARPAGTPSRRSRGSSGRR